MSSKEDGPQTAPPPLVLPSDAVKVEEKARAVAETEASKTAAEKKREADAAALVNSESDIAAAVRAQARINADSADAKWSSNLKTGAKEFLDASERKWKALGLAEKASSALDNFYGPFALFNIYNVLALVIFLLAIGIVVVSFVVSDDERRKALTVGLAITILVFGMTSAIFRLYLREDWLQHHKIEEKALAK